MKFNHPELTSMADSVRTKAEQVIALGQKKGADRIKCTGSAGVQSRLVVENGDFTLCDTIGSQSLGLLVHKDSKKGSATTNDLEDASLAKSVDDALALASFSVKDEDLTMADQSFAPRAESLSFMTDHSVCDLKIEALGEAVKAVLEEFRKEPKFALDRLEISSHLSYHTLHNSLGIHQDEFQTMVSWSYLGMARDGEEVSGMDYDSGFSFGWNNTPAHMKEKVRSYLERVIASLHPKKCPVYRGPVLIAPRAVRTLIGSSLLYHTSGRAVMDGKSRWPNAIGQKVVSDKITIKDHPHDPDLAGVTTFDGDGLPTRERTIFEQGVLKCHLHDCYSAKKLGTTSNAMSGGPFGLQFYPGDANLEDLRQAHPNLLEVNRFSGNVDSLTGDFSGVAKSSRLFHQGKDAGAVTETMIAGNVFEIAQNILGVSKELDIVSGSFKAPYILVDQISIS